MSHIKTVGLAVVFALVAMAGQAQTKEKKMLTLDGAKMVAAAAEAEARKNNAGAAIAVVDDGGNLMLLVRLDETFAAGANVSIGKARTAALFKKPTKFFEDIVNNGRTTMVALSDFTPLQGGVPIVVDGQVVGGVGVSGAASAQQDEEIAMVGAQAIGTMKMSSSEIFYLENKKVTEAFKKGAPLIEVTDYKVHASHRDRGGEAEIHEGETDIIYVLEGSATFVTGGTVVDGRTTAPGETRGAGIQGGDTRQITRGDVIIVPRGTPHWFKNVDGIINYYVVKVL
ncbi:MAG TPA: heme-binding protein [Vicinamibacteria bacterium]|jgi:glc operon protein GlcG